MLGVLLIAADLAGSLAVSDRTEIRARAPGTASAVSFDLETALAARLSPASPRLRYTLAYSPRLTVWDLDASPPKPTLLHGGTARVEWMSSRSVRLSLDETGSYGGM